MRLLQKIGYIQVVIDPKRTTATFDSTVMAVVHNVSTLHEIKVRRRYRIRIRQG